MSRLIQYRIINGKYVLIDVVRGEEALEEIADDFLIPSQFKKSRSTDSYQNKKCTQDTELTLKPAYSSLKTGKFST